MRRSFPALALGLVVLVGCTPDAPSSAPTPAMTPTSAGASPLSPSTAASSSTPSAAATPTRSASPSASPSREPARRPNPISVAALMVKSYDGDDLDRGRLLADVGPYKRYLATYRSEGLTVSGVLFVPDGDGPFPVVVTNHGYIDPDRYFPGQGMPREEDYLARRGYVVLHVDYRGHASGDDDPDVDYELRLPYAVDTINAVYAVKRSKARYLDGDRVAWLGRSMGGSVTLNALVAKPGLVDAAVIYASTSSLAADNWRQFSRDGEDQRTNRRIERGYGRPEDNPRFWRAASSRPFFGRVTEPLMVHHGRQDDTCPISWSRETIRALRAEGKQVRHYFYAGQGHTFEGAAWQTSIRRTRAFLDRELA